MIIRPTTPEERLALFIETVLNNTDKVTKVAPHGVLSGIGIGIGELLGLVEKDIAIAIAKLSPDTAIGSELDDLAQNLGIPPRYTTPHPSSGYIKLIAPTGTVYDKNTTYFISKSGIQFNLDDSITIGVRGWEYTSITSNSTGIASNVRGLDISQTVAPPIGHQFAINESPTIGGRDIESDIEFRQRIKSGVSSVSKGTLESLFYHLNHINSKVLRVFYQGITREGKCRLSLVTVNGQDLTGPELDDLTQSCAPYLSLFDSQPLSQNSFLGVEFVNHGWEYIDVAFRIEYDISYSIDAIRMEIESLLIKYFDHRLFDTTRYKVEWDTLLGLVKSVNGVTYVPDEYFYPKHDIRISPFKLPRLRGLVLMSLSGDILQDLNNSLAPIYSQTPYDPNFIRTIL